MANAGTITLPPRCAVARDQSRQFWQRVFLGMHPISVGRFHHHQVGSLALGWTGVDNLSRCDFLVAHAANVAGEQQVCRVWPFES